jgi:hypothetical protein
MIYKILLIKKLNQLHNIWNINVSTFVEAHLSGMILFEDFQNVNFEKPVVLKDAHDYNNKKIVPQLFKILRSFTSAWVLKIKNLW